MMQNNSPFGELEFTPYVCPNGTTENLSGRILASKREKYAHETTRNYRNYEKVQSNVEKGKDRAYSKLLWDYWWKYEKLRKGKKFEIQRIETHLLLAIESQSSVPEAKRLNRQDNEKILNSDTTLKRKK